MRRIAFVCLWLAMAPGLSAAQPAGVRVTGVVIDAINAQPLPGVTVAIVGSERSTITELDGRFSLMVPPGQHQLKVSLEGFRDKNIQITAEEGKPIDLSTSLAIAGFTEQVTVTGENLNAESSTAAAQLLERRRATVISDNLGAQEMKQNADSNAASGLQRVTGLSVVNNQFVFVRGLGERYSNTTLNGATIPSTQPERRVVSLDMFPAGLLDNVSVVKSYTPDRPAEFAGGLVEIVPSRLPNRPVFNLSYDLGFNTVTTAEEVFDYVGSGSDWLARDDGRRALPGSIPNRRVIRGGIFTPELGFSRQELEALGEAFENMWEPVGKTARPANQWSAVYGSRWNRFGLLASFNQNQRPQFRDEIQRYYRVDGDSLSTFSDYVYQAYEVKSTWSGMLNAGYQLDPNHRLSFQGFSTNSGTRETRTFEGFNADAGRDLANTRLLWVEENLNSAQVTGEHFFPAMSNSRIEWRGAYSRSNRDEPDIRETLYEDIGGRFQLADESQSGFRMFNDLDEDAFDFAVSWATSFTSWNGLPTMIKVGPQYTRRERDFSSRRFRFIPIDVRGFDLTRPPEELFAPANIGPVFELREETRATDTYLAEQEILGVYGMIDLPMSSRWRLAGGVRVERFEQRVDTFDLFDTDFDEDPDIIRAQIDETDVFPAVNLVYAVRHDQNVRLSFSQTVNRPEFRELAPFEFTDIVGGRAVVGNPDLTRSLIQNYDVRWEWFPRGEEVIAASFFYKNFNDPIERFVEPTAQLRTSFQNAESARNVGIELEGRKLVAPGLFVGGNYTFIDSSITLAPSQTNVLTTLRRPLAGTSENLFNGFVEARVAAFTARLLLNYVGDRIIDVGSLGLPDIFEKGRSTVDLVAHYRLPRFSIRFAADNLSDRPIEYTQGGLTQRRFEYGRTISVQFGFSAF